MPDRRHRWYPTDRDYRALWEHLERQRDVDPRHHVRLDDDTLVRVGHLAVGER
jgi:hypothetical protein